MNATGQGADSPRIVLVFDSYDQSVTELRRWLEGIFLEKLMVTFEPIVVMGGRRLEGAQWEWSTCFQLEPIDLHFWKEYSQKKIWPIEESFIDEKFALTCGLPFLVANCIETEFRSQNRGER